MTGSAHVPPIKGVRADSVSREVTASGSLSFDARSSTAGVMHEEMLKISAITRAEIDSIKALWQGLNSHHLAKTTHFKEHFSNLTFERRIEALNKRDRLLVYVAQEHCESVGYCITTVDGSMGEIDSLFVKAAYRGQGVGEKLVTRALKWLEEQGCETVRVSIAEGNEQVLDFYRRFGFAERFIVMEKPHNLPSAADSAKAGRRR